MLRPTCDIDRPASLGKFGIVRRRRNGRPNPDAPMPCTGDGRNVVIHEFAHQIDQDKGVADGRPWRASRRQRQRWAAVMGPAFEHLQHQPSALISPYGASAPAEFFAVLSEVFFEQPQALAAEAPELYRELALLYHGTVGSGPWGQDRGVGPWGQVSGPWGQGTWRNVGSGLPSSPSH